MGAVVKDVLLILYIISIAQVTSREGIVGPGHYFNSWGVGKLEACHAADDVMREVKKHNLGRMNGECVTRALSAGGTRDGTTDKLSVCCCALVDAYQNEVPNIPSASHEVHNKMTEINGLTLQQPFFEDVGCLFVTRRERTQQCP